MGSASVSLERRGHVAVLTFEDPERLNAMTEAMGRALSARVDELRDDADLRAVVLTGAGRAFSAGGDFEMIIAKGEAGRRDPGGETRQASRDFMRNFYSMYLRVRELPCPTIAAINGPAIGAGFCVALACDLRVAAQRAKLGLNFVRLGMHPGMGATWTLPRIVGHAIASELLYTGRIIDGEEAARLGLVNRAVGGEDVLAEALALADEIAISSPLAVRGVREALAGSGTATLSEQLDFEAAEQSRNYESEDLVEGIAAVREKRPPSFRGR
jgi:enoyl-CoA hydratase/carnithine racemase